MDEATSSHYEFQVHGPDGVVTLSFSVEDGAPWPEVVRRFSDFMSAVYGYRINELDKAAK